MQIPYYQINAFTEQFNGGNPAGVCPLTEWLSDETMQLIAAENNLSETAFFVPEKETSDADYCLRWFTPSCEVDLCGHATLATAHYLFAIAKVDKKTISFVTKSGILTVENDQLKYLMELPFSPYQACETPEQVINGLNATPNLSFCNDDLVLIFDDEDFIKKVVPDFPLIQAIDYRCLVISAPSETPHIDFVSRVFGSKDIGITEDPATGSTHPTLAHYWGKKWNRTQLVGQQLSKRSAIIECHLKEQSSIISGRAFCYSQGVINI